MDFSPIILKFFLICAFFIAKLLFRARIVCSCPTTHSEVVKAFMKKATSHLQTRLVEQWELLKRKQAPDEG